MPIWLPNGAIVRSVLERYIVDAERDSGYAHVLPTLGRKAMYEISGHWDHFAEAMFPPIDDGAEQVVLRPMNCPHHIVAYRCRPRPGAIYRCASPNSGPCSATSRRGPCSVSRGCGRWSSTTPTTSSTPPGSPRRWRS